jgi:hypothetical protein
VVFLVLLFALFLGSGGVARADEAAPCPERIAAWVGRASRDIDVPIEARQCVPGIVLRLAPEGAPTLDVEVIARGPDANRAFEHAGKLGVSPRLEVPEFQDLPAPQRESFARLLAWLRAHEGEVAFGAVELPVSRDGAPRAAIFCVLVGLALAAIASRRRRVDRDDLLVGAALFAASLTVHLTLGPWGPFHVNGQGPLWILGAVASPHELLGYGNGYAAILGPLARALPGHEDTAIFAANAALSALFPLLVFALARSVGVVRGCAALVASVAAMDPVGVRFGATESYLPLLIALDGASALSLLLMVTSFERGARRGGLAWLGAAACFACASSQVHPVALLGVALAPLIALAAPGERSGRRRLAFLMTAAACIGLAALVGIVLGDTNVRGALLGETASHARTGSAAALMAVVVIGAAVVARSATRARWLVPGAAAHVLAGLATMGAFGQSRLWQNAYLHLYALVPLVLVAALLPTSFAPRRISRLIALVAAMTLLSAACPVTWRRTTEHEEARWLRRELASLPADCRVAFVQSEGRGVMFLPLYDPARLVRLLGADVGTASALPGDTCTYYVHTSLCETREARDACEAVEHAMSLEAVSETSFEPRPSADARTYEDDAVHDVLSRVTNRWSKGGSNP